MNELDVLVNVDLATRTIKKNHTALNIIRIGTSGALQSNIPINSVLVSEQAIGLDSLMLFYERKEDVELEQSIKEQLGFNFINPYWVNGNKELVDLLPSNYLKGITATCCGFYGPQGRFLRAKGVNSTLIEKLNQLNINGKSVTNFEMETAGIYGLANVLGHKAVSVNCILANRITNEFSKKPAEIVDRTIREVLEKL
jgi:uridine phosphorylase